jgi:hypothetical protein
MMRMRSWKRTERYSISYLPRQMQRDPRIELSLGPAFQRLAFGSACQGTMVLGLTLAQAVEVRVARIEAMSRVERISYIIVRWRGGCDG